MTTTEQNLVSSIEALSRKLNEHLGSRGALSTAFIPHTQLCAISHGAYTVTNAVDRRTFNPTTVTLQQLAEVVGTIISDLQAIKVLG